MMVFPRIRMLSKLLICLIVLLNFNCKKKNNPINKNDELVNIIYFFIDEYNLPKKSNILISEHDLLNYSNIEILDSLDYVYIHIQDYHNDVPFVKSNTNRELFRSKIDSYNIYYEVNMEESMKIPNNLEWEKVNINKSIENHLMIIDYVELQCLYNLKTKKIEL